jgi:hypothetical protein
VGSGGTGGAAGLGGSTSPDVRAEAAGPTTEAGSSSQDAVPRDLGAAADGPTAPGGGGDGPSAPAPGTVYFQNQGNTKGWTVLGPAQHGGSIVDDPAVAYRDSGGSVRSTCIYEAPSGERFHSEPRVDGVGAASGADRYYGYALYLPRDWSYEGKERHVTAQFGVVQVKPNYFQHWVINDRLQMGPIDGQSVTLGTISVGEWHRIVTHLRFSTSGQGIVEVWYDGQKVVTALNTLVPGASTVASGKGAFLWALGLYEAGWLSGNVGPQKTRVVHNAKIRVASSAELADPMNW